MLHLAAIVASIGLADSLNPSTIAPALYLASGRHPVARVMEFTIGVFIVYMVGGLLIALGPGELILDLVPRPSYTVRHVIEVIAGVALIIAACVLWHKRHALGARKAQPIKTGSRSSAILGATISAVELPTAFPYFAAIATIVGSGVGVGRQISLIVLFNVCFVMPLIAIMVVLTVAGDHAQVILTGARRWLRAHWPQLLAIVGLLAGVFVVLLGLTGLFGGKPFGRFLRRRLFKPIGLGRLSK